MDAASGFCLVVLFEGKLFWFSPEFVGAMPGLALSMLNFPTSPIEGLVPLVPSLDFLGGGRDAAENCIRDTHLFISACVVCVAL